MENEELLESYLHQLRLPTFANNYRAFATDAAQNNLDYPRYLLALAEQEVTKREQNMLAKRLKAARFPVAKELADFNFSAVPGLNKIQVLDLAGASTSPSARSLYSLEIRDWEKPIWPSLWPALPVGREKGALLDGGRAGR